VLYAMTAWLFVASVGARTPSGPGEAIRLAASAFSTAPGLTLWLAACAAAFVAFNGTHSRLYRWLGGLGHAAVHWVCAFHVGWAAIAASEWLLPGGGAARFVAASAMVLAGGWVVGSTVMGLYLLVSLNVFGRHSQEAFSAMRIPDYRNFLRLHVAADGTLTVHPLRVDRVPRRWREREAGRSEQPAALVPDEPLVVSMIEAPIVLRPGGVDAERPPAG